MIVAGFGCRDSADAASLHAALALALDGMPAPSALATLAHKAPLLAPVAEVLGLPMHVIDRSAIAGLATPTCSPASLVAYRTGSVAEAVALAAAGDGARLIVHRIVSPDGRATCALAERIPE